MNRSLAAKLLIGANDVRHGARRLARSPGRLLLAAATAGVGVGATVIMLTLVQQVLLRPLPFDQPDRLVRLVELSNDGRNWWPSFPNFSDWRAAATSPFQAIGAVAVPLPRPVIVGESATRVAVGGVSRGLFETLRVDMARGRPIADDENRPGTPATAVVSFAFWNGALGGRSLDEKMEVTVGGESYRVVGVLPADFRFLGDGGAWQQADIWLPMERSGGLGGRTSHGYHVVGRLRDGLDLDAAQASIDAIAAQIEATGEPTNAHTVPLTRLQDVVVGSARQPVQMLTAGAFAVLFIACFNLAATLLVEGLGRGHELAVRRALGAGRGALAWHLASEAALLAIPGVAAGVAVAAAGIRGIQRFFPAAVARIDSVHINATTLATAAAVAVVSALAADLAPALMLSSPSATGAFRGAGRASDSRHQRRLWQGFIAAQIALTLVLLTGSGLLLRSFVAAVSVDVGYEARDVVDIDVSLPESLYAADAQRLAYFDTALTRVRALPGVAAAGVTDILPHITTAMTSYTSRFGDDDARSFGAYRLVDSGYFATLGIPLLVGELPMDDASPAARVEGVAARAGAVDRTLVDALWGDDNPIGGEVRNGFTDGPLRVEAVVGSVREWHMTHDPIGAIYVDYRTRPERLTEMHILVKADDPAALMPRLAQLVRSFDPLVPMSVGYLTDRAAESLAGRRLLLMIAVAFALVALFLAVVGVYGVVAYVTRRQTREVGIRIALGARPAQVRLRMLGHGVWPMALGLGAGIVAAVPVGLGIRAQLFGVSPWDPAVLAAALALVAITAALAGYIPARRAARVDPVSVLRES